MSKTKTGLKGRLYFCPRDKVNDPDAWMKAGKLVFMDTEDNSVGNRVDAMCLALVKAGFDVEIQYPGGAVVFGLYELFRPIEDTCNTIYEQHGCASVCDYVAKNHPEIPFLRCESCDADTPHLGKEHGRETFNDEPVCLACGNKGN